MTATLVDRAAIEKACGLHRLLANERRLMLLCMLYGGARTVGELQALLNLRQAEVSQVLTPLRLQGYVSFEKVGRSRRYALARSFPRDVLRDVAQAGAGERRAAPPRAGTSA